ncbi:unnamed protein product [Closterium sp. Naga37s-1]|nr:unnamed protein product [Closterium sp. Naga37s-1]
MAERVKQEPRPAAKKAEEQIKLDMGFETGERLIQPGGQESGERAGGKHVGIRASAEPEPSQTSESTSAVKEPAAGKAVAGKGFGKAPQQPAVVRRPAPSQPLLSTQPMGEEEKKAAEIETAVVVSLGLVFVLIILEGLFLAAAGECIANLGREGELER